ncbi:hypothetical protein [Cerasicoccus frondis]|uniref:hypothetical protein n=1 Tax=Cerasicoccus frondis TaxID=490090 RepID=UPI0028526527|nr:hypothetical protein [Cerasicoccus frondis]
MKKPLSIFIAASAVTLLGVGCDADQAKAVEQVDVAVGMEKKASESPVNGATVSNAKTEARTYATTVNRPAGQDDDAELSHYPIIAKVDVDEPGYDLEIKKVVELYGKIAVISELKKATSGNSAKTVVQDSVHLDHEPQGDIVHYVITDLDNLEGQNGEYHFGASLAAFGLSPDEGRVIYVSSAY